MALNALECTGQPSTTEKYLTLVVSSVLGCVETHTHLIQGWQIMWGVNVESFGNNLCAMASSASC